MPIFSSNFGPVCSKVLSFRAENRPFLSSCKRSLFSAAENNIFFFYELAQLLSPSVHPSIVKWIFCFQQLNQAAASDLTFHEFHSLGRRILCSSEVFEAPKFEKRSVGKLLFAEADSCTSFLPFQQRNVSNVICSTRSEFEGGTACKVFIQAKEDGNVL